MPLRPAESSRGYRVLSFGAPEVQFLYQRKPKRINWLGAVRCPISKRAVRFQYFFGRGVVRNWNQAPNTEINAATIR
jgi:hypothetical protein